jgi:predicted CoA-binding protein
MVAADFLKFKNWVVAGDVANETKYAYRILNALKAADINAAGVKPESNIEGVYNNLKDMPYKIEVLDLCINPYKGIKIVEEALKLGINKILIQPGAESEEIISFCKNNAITAIEGCALVELSRR